LARQLAKDLENEGSSSDSESDSDSSESSDEEPPGIQQNRYDPYYNSAQEQSGARVPFNRECFKQLIQRTFEDYYPGVYNTERFDLKEYLQLVSDE
jgi:hypothetical protein